MDRLVYDYYSHPVNGGQPINLSTYERYRESVKSTRNPSETEATDAQTVLEVLAAVFNVKFQVFSGSQFFQYEKINNNIFLITHTQILPVSLIVKPGGWGLLYRDQPRIDLLNLALSKPGFPPLMSNNNPYHLTFIKLKCGCCADVRRASLLSYLNLYFPK